MYKDMLINAIQECNNDDLIKYLYLILVKVNTQGKD